MSDDLPRFFSDRSLLAKIKWSGLTVQIFFSVILPLSILLLGVTFGSLNLHQDAMRRLVGERDERTARSTASALNEQLKHRSAAVLGLALRSETQTSLSTILTSAEYLHPDFDKGLAFFDDDRTLLTATNEGTFWNALDGEIGRALTNSLADAGAQPQFSPPLFHPEDGAYLVFVFARSSPRSPIIVGAFSITELADRSFAGIRTADEQSNIFLVDDQGQVLFQTGPLQISDPPILHPGVQEALQGESGTTYNMVENKEHVVAYNPVEPTGWALVIEESWDAVASPLLQYTGLGSLVLVPILIISIGALWFGARQIIQPLKNLEVRSRALAWGDFQAIREPVGGIGEIGHLQEALIHMANRVQIAQRGLRGYIGAITAGQEEERRRLARELHDDTIQSLIALNQKVEFARRSFADKKTAGSMDEVQSLINQTIQDLRRLTHALRPLYLEDLGLVPAVEMLTRETSRDSGIPINFEAAGTERHLPEPQAIAIFRMAQEGLSNITRHSHATQGLLTLNFDQDKIVLVISDNGQGFAVPENPAEFAPRGHYGLLGIHERAELFGAQLEIKSSIGDGTKLVVIIPNQAKDIATSN